MYPNSQGGGRFCRAEEVRVIEVSSTAVVGFEELWCQQGWDASPGLTRAVDVGSINLVDSSVVQSSEGLF